MKRTFFSLVLALMAALTLSAQTILMGDTNSDGQLSIADVTSTVNMVLGKSPAQTVDLSGMAYRVDNSGVAGRWKAPDNSRFTLNTDGTTDYPGAATYEFRPFQGTLLFCDALGNPVRMLHLAVVASDHLLAVDCATQGFTLYTNDSRVTAIALSSTSLTLNSGATAQLTATVTPSDALNPSLQWTSSDESVATVSPAGLVTAVAPGTAVITCTATDGSGAAASCTVVVDNSGSIDGRDYVDLGLPSGTLWATCNIGADSPEDYGLYFAWGETTGYTQNTTDGHSFNWASYKYAIDDYNTLTKYCNDSRYGYNYFTDTLTELELSDDAAYVNWGADWHMPSYDQIRELYHSDYTMITWTTQNGVKGIKITSNSNGNSFFLPAAGFRFDTSLFYAGSDCNYWSRTLGPEYPFSAYGLTFYPSTVARDYDYRRSGRSVRPVRNQ